MEGDGWDLQAVVSGCSGSTATVDPFSSFPSLALQGGSGEQDDLRFCFPELFDTQTELFELEDLWKPFFPDSPQPQSQPQQQLPLSPQRSISSSSSAAPQPPPAVGEAALLPLPQLPTRPPQQRTLPHTPKSRRRKSQQKKVVCHVPADGLSSDMWAWRKYGQKPIKGSPYPRGYYRCSTSKGCVARKQVERSRVDPGEFVVTYTGEHNHPLPTHRNSLAGSTRNKLPAPPSADASSAAPGAEPGRSECKAASPSPLSSPTPSGLSPTTPLAASVEEELLLPRGLGGQKGEGGEEVEGEEEEDLLLVGDIEMLGEDDVLFMGFEELREPTAGIFGDAFSEYLGAFPTQWTASNAAAAAGGS